MASIRPAFPGMNPYLENPSIWPEVHYGLMSTLMRVLNPQLNPKYRVAVETQTSTEAAERYLEVREVGSGRVVSMIELLSPKNKQSGEGRRQ